MIDIEKTDPESVTQIILRNTVGVRHGIFIESLSGVYSFTVSDFIANEWTSYQFKGLLMRNMDILIWNGTIEILLNWISTGEWRIERDDYT